MTLGGIDMSILSTISPPDPEAERKYEAMGLPDPVAFAALTAMGAIPNPMELLNDMMLAAQDRIDGEAETPPPAATAEGEPAEEAMSGGWLAEPSLGTPSGQLASPLGRGQPHAPGLAVPPGKSFVEAFRELQQRRESQEAQQTERSTPSGPVGGYAAAAQRARGQQAQSEGDNVEVEKLEERLAKSAKELADQARIAADRAKEVAHTAAQMATANRDASSALDPEVMRAFGVREGTAKRGVAQIFSTDADDDEAEDRQPPPSKTGSLQTLSSLLTGRQSADVPGALATSTPGGPALEKICISRMPQGVTESAVRLECARHGAVTSVILEADGSAAYVSFAAPDMAATAVRRMTGRPGVLGSTAEPLQVRLISEIPDSVRLAAVPAPLAQEPVNAADLPEYLRPREGKKKRGSRTRKKSRSRSRDRRRRSQRKKRRKSRSMVRWLDRSRSNSHTATGQYIRATGCSSTVRWWDKKESSSSTSRSSKSHKRPGDEDPSSRRPRQVAVRGNWAQFVQSGTSYYYNVITGQTTWERPSDFDVVPSRRPEAGAPRATGALL